MRPPTWAGNGTRLGLSPAGKREPPRRPLGTGVRYGFAVLSVALASGLAAAGDRAFSFPPLILFAAAVAATAAFSGVIPGLLALALATLASDLFFVSPRYVFSLDRTVFRLAAFYLLAGLVSYFFNRQLPAPAKTW